jgi:hypothetical protein
MNLNVPISKKYRAELLYVIIEPFYVIYDANLQAYEF